MKRKFQWTWKCAGCGGTTDLVLEVEQRTLDRAMSPAHLLALERNALMRTAAEAHARNGCSLPV